MTTTLDCHNFVANLNRHGVPVPVPLADVIAVFDELDSVTAAPSKPDALAADVVAGKVKPGKIAARVEEAARDLATRAHVGAAVDATCVSLVAAFTDAIRGEVGDQIIEALRPRFDTAVAGIAAAAGLFGPDSQPGDVIARGTEATIVWNAMAGHRVTLDAIVTDIIRPLGHTFAVLGNRSYDRPNDAIVCWLISPDNPDNSVQRSAHSTRWPAPPAPVVAGTGSSPPSTCTSTPPAKPPSYSTTAR